MTRISVEDQQRNARAVGALSTVRFHDADAGWLLKQVTELAEALAGEGVHARQYRLGQLAGYITILSDRGEHVALIETMRDPTVFKYMTEAKRKGG